MGKLVATIGINEYIKGNLSAIYEIQGCLSRHMFGDWGDIEEEDKQINEYALIHGGRLFSRYVLSDKVTIIYIITEADRSATTILFPEEY